MIALYFVVKWAVKNGMLEAYKEIEKKKAQEALKADKTISDLEKRSQHRKYLWRYEKCIIYWC